MLEQGIPLEAVLTELILSGEVERTMRLVRQSGDAAQFGYHSPTSQYGQLTRRGEDHTPHLPTPMRPIGRGHPPGPFPRRWGAARGARHPQPPTPREQH